MCAPESKGEGVKWSGSPTAGMVRKNCPIFTDHSCLPGLRTTYRGGNVPRRQFDTGVDAGRNDAAPKSRTVSAGAFAPPRTARSLAAVLLVAFAAILGLPLQAEAQTGVCGRTEQVRDEILDEISGVTDCADVTDAHLAAITGTLSLDREGITALAAGDFDGLTKLTQLQLQNNSLDHASRRGVRRADRADAGCIWRATLWTRFPRRVRGADRAERAGAEAE